MRLGGIADLARVKNLSTAGVCCTTDRPLPLLSVVQVTFLLPGILPDGSLISGDPATCEVTCTGAVVRSVRNGQGAGTSLYESAIYFTEVDDADRTALDHYVASLRRAGQVA